MAEIQPQRTALLMIDMQNAFIDASSPFCVAGAAETVPACAKALAFARENVIGVYHVRREYAADGHDVEPARYAAWLAGGRPLCAEGDNPSLLDPPDLLTDADGDRTLVKPSYSAFFGTSLHTGLRRENKNTVVLMGTAAPNCVRATCYDALSLRYNVVLLTDAISAATSQVLETNLADMQAAGAKLMTVAEFCAGALTQLEDVVNTVNIAVGRAVKKPADATMAAGAGSGADVPIAAPGMQAPGMFAPGAPSARSSVPGGAPQAKSGIPQ